MAAKPEIFTSRPFREMFPKSDGETINNVNEIEKLHCWLSAGCHRQLIEAALLLVMCSCLASKPAREDIPCVESFSGLKARQEHSGGR